jgi:hypothetical protein
MKRTTRHVAQRWELPIKTARAALHNMELSGTVSRVGARWVLSPAAEQELATLRGSVLIDEVEEIVAALHTSRDLAEVFGEIESLRLRAGERDLRRLVRALAQRLEIATMTSAERRAA